MKVSVFVPCFIDQFYPQIGFNMIKVLEKAGCSVHYNPEQTCCGQPGYNSGFKKQAKKVARKFLNDFQGNEAIIIPSASCAGFIKNYYKHILPEENHLVLESFSNRVFELSDFLVNSRRVTEFDARLDGVAVYHDSCAGLREYGIRKEPRKLLEGVEGLQLLEMKETDVCCGFGGSFSIDFEAISCAMGNRKIANLMDKKAQFLISTDMSCLMHLDGLIKKQNLPVKSFHLVDVLASGWN